ncbi:MAG: hypothetical protein II863_15050, partial [Kiritimatiellae bacterium]|nr:hypothetical protein [Kiritimatiellia bacterium]
SSIVPFTSQTALAGTGIDPSCVSLTPKVNLYTPFCGALAVVKAAAAKTIMLALAKIPVFNFMDDSSQMSPTFYQNRSTAVLPDGVY